MQLSQEDVRIIGKALEQQHCPGAYRCDLCARRTDLRRRWYEYITAFDKPPLCHVMSGEPRYIYKIDVSGMTTAEALIALQKMDERMR